MIKHELINYLNEAEQKVISLINDRLPLEISGSNIYELETDIQNCLFSTNEILINTLGIEISYRLDINSETGTVLPVMHILKVPMELIKEN